MFECVYWPGPEGKPRLPFSIEQLPSFMCQINLALAQSLLHSDYVMWYRWSTWTSVSWIYGH